MRQIINSVSRGSYHYTTGRVEKSKYHAFAVKMCKFYDVDRNATQRARAKSKGLANTTLIAWSSKKDSYVHFVLLATDGDGSVHDCEKLCDANNKHERIVITGYELLKLPQADKAPGLTWRMTKDTFQNWQFKIKDATQSKHRDAIAQIIYSLTRAVGFRGVRSQLFDLKRELKYALQRHFNKNEADKFELPKFGWIGRYKTIERIDSLKVCKWKT